MWWKTCLSDFVQYMFNLASWLTMGRLWEHYDRLWKHYDRLWKYYDRLGKHYENTMTDYDSTIIVLCVQLVPVLLMVHSTITCQPHIANTTMDSKSLTAMASTEKTSLQLSRSHFHSHNIVEESSEDGCKGKACCWGSGGSKQKKTTAGKWHHVSNCSWVEKSKGSPKGRPNK